MVIFLLNWEIWATAKGLRGNREQGLSSWPSLSRCGRRWQETGKEAGLVRESTWTPVIVWYHLGPAKTRTNCSLGLCNASHMGTVRPGQCSETGTTHPWNLYKLHFEVFEGTAHFLQPEAHGREEEGSTNYQVPRAGIFTWSYLFLPPTLLITWQEGKRNENHRITTSYRHFSLSCIHIISSLPQKGRKSIQVSICSSGKGNTNAKATQWKCVFGRRATKEGVDARETPTPR